jgi:DNA-binding MarR family transcriptional regulator
MKPSQRLASVLDALLRRLRELERDALARHLPRGVTPGDVRVLRAVERVGASGVSAVAGYLGTSQPAATVAVARLEGRGLVVRAANAADGRRKALALTAKGRQIEASHGAADAEAAERLLARLPKGERAAAVELLAKIADEAAREEG